MVVFGGRSDELGPLHTGRELYDSDLYFYDTITRHWHKPDVSGDIPEGRRSHNACKIYVLEPFNLSDIRALDSATVGCKWCVGSRCLNR